MPDRQTVTQCLIPVYSDVLLCDLFCLSVDPNKTIDLGILIRMTDRAIRNQVEHPRKRDRGCSRPISAYTHARSNPQDRSAFISRSSLILDWHGIIIPNSRNGMIVRAPHSYRLFDLTFIRLVEDLELHIPRRRFRWKVIPTANS